MNDTPRVFVTNFNPNFTGVSATAAAVLRAQTKGLNPVLVGHPLPGCPDPISLATARRLSRRPPAGLPFVIWHVRRNTEMRAALIARDLWRLPIRIVFTSAAQRRHSALPRWLISRMDAVIATTEEAAGFVPHVRAVVPHGVDTDLFHPAKIRAKAWRDTGLPGAYGIANVGRIRPEKGTDLFVDAMLAALPKLPGATALIFGKAAKEHRSFQSDLTARIAFAGLTDRILFMGEQPAAKMPGFLRACSLLVALPRYEGYGMTPLEAMASAVPFVASDTGFFRQFAGQGAGRIVPPEDAAQAAQEILFLLATPLRLQAAATVARVRAIQSFGIAKEVAGIESVYQMLWDAQGA